MRDQLSFYALCIAFAVVTIYFDLSYFGQGVIVGAGIAIAWIAHSETSIKSALMFCIVGAVGLVLAFHFSDQYGMSFVKMDETRSLGKFVRRLPFYSITALTAGTLLALHHSLGKLSEKYD